MDCTEFKEFAMKGNVMDLAVGVIIGAAFGKIVDSVPWGPDHALVSMRSSGSIDFSSMFVVSCWARCLSRDR